MTGSIALDAETAQRRATLPDASVWVSANAGTGKTKVLTDRVLALLLDGTAPARILCLTFTRAAAAEMAIRISGALGHWAACSDEKLSGAIEVLTGRAPDDAMRARARALFAEVLEVPGRMKIQTIHAFCESLLRRFPLEAGLAPHFQLMEDDRTAGEALHAARDRVLMQLGDDGEEALAAALEELAGRLNEDDFAKLIGALTGERARLRRAIGRHRGVDGLIAAVYRLLGVGPRETRDDVVRAACDDTALDLDGLRRACETLATGNENDQDRAARIGDWLSNPSRREASFEAYLNVFLTAEKKSRATRNLITKAPREADPAAADALIAEAERLVAVEMKFRALVTAGATAALIRLGDALLTAYAEHKQAHALLDYDDLILHARDVLESDGGASWVLYKLDGGIDHILIDEAQDTNPDQWAVIRALAGEFFAGEGVREDPRTVFAVGDPKQSIYSFQRADPDAFEAMRAHFEERVEGARGRWDSVALEVSFRSASAVLQAVDAVFAQAAARDGVAGAGQRIHHLAYREGQAGLVELWPAVAPEDAEARDLWSVATGDASRAVPEARLAQVIAGRIRRWIADGEVLQSKDRPLRPGDIMVLVRRRTAFVDELVRALKQKDVPVAGVDRMVLTGQLAVMDLVALGRFLLLAEDDLTLATVLKGPLFGLDDDALFELAWDRGEASLWQELARRRDEDARYAAAHEELAALLARADFVPPFELFSDVLARRGGRCKTAGRLGPDANDPLDEFLGLALAFERIHPPSLQAFLQWVEEGQAVIKRDLDHGVRDEVRVMTVHGAKGLQAPVVFLPDTLTAPRGNQGPAPMWREDGIPLWPPKRAFEERVSAALRAEADARRDREYRRLLYVAMTRAEDRLYICGWQGRNRAPDDCWYRLVEGTMAGICAATDFDFTADSPEGWSGTGYRLETPQSGKPDERDESRRLAAAPVAPPGWARSPAPPEAVPPRPLAPSRPDEDEPAPRSPLGEDRGEMFRRGNLIHALLQTLPEIAPEARAAAARRYLARAVHGLGAAQQADYAAETLAVLDQPEFAALFGPGSRGEVPLAGCINGRVISGQVDRLVVGPETVRVLDYKTNRPPPVSAAEVPALYLRQMAAYRAVLEAVYPYKSISCSLLWTDGPKLMELPRELLRRFAP